MKTVGVHEVKQSLSSYLIRAQKEDILILNHGRPAALVVGVGGQELEDLLLQRDPNFWKMIERSRSQRAVYSAEEIRSGLGIPAHGRRRKARRGSSGRTRARRAR